MNAPASKPDKYKRYRQRMKARGLKEVRLWVYDPDAPGFAEEMARQAALLRDAIEEAEVMDFIEAAWTELEAQISEDEARAGS